MGYYGTISKNLLTMESSLISEQNLQQTISDSNINDNIIVVVLYPTLDTTLSTLENIAASEGIALDSNTLNIISDALESKYYSNTDTINRIQGSLISIDVSNPHSDHKLLNEINNNPRIIQKNSRHDNTNNLSGNIPKIVQAKSIYNTPESIIGKIARAEINTHVNTVNLNAKNIIYGMPPTQMNRIGEQDIAIDEKNFVLLKITNIGELVYVGGDDTGTALADAFRIEPKFAEFQEILGDVLGQNAVIPDNVISFVINQPSVSQTMSNDYQSSILESSLNFVSNALTDYTYLTGGNAQSFGRMLDATIEPLDKAFNGKISGALGGFLNTLGISGGTGGNTSVGGQVANAMGNINTKLQNSSWAKLLQGYRIDVPNVWKGSSTNKSFTAKIKLRAIIDNDDSILNNVIVPYAILKVLSSPISDDNSYMYKWPFLMTIEVPGIVYIPLAVIKSATFTKPATSVYTHSGRFLDIDVTVEFDSLYNTEFSVKSKSIPQYMLSTNLDVKKTIEGLLKSI